GGEYVRVVGCVGRIRIAYVLRTTRPLGIGDEVGDNAFLAIDDALRPLVALGVAQIVDPREQRLRLRVAPGDLVDRVLDRLGTGGIHRTCKISLKVVDLAFVAR